MTLSRRSLLAAGAAAVAARALEAGAQGLPTVPAAARTGDLLGELSYLVTGRDTILLDEAWSRDLGILEISAANPGVDPWVPGPERLVTLPTAHLLPDAERGGLVINKAELRLYFFPAGGGVETHAIGIGREGHDTPDGQTSIVRKKKEPTWYPTASTRQDRPELPAEVGPGPDNPLGDRALYFGWPTYLMHGTNKPYGVGRRVSRGCIRLYPEVARHLFEVVPVGTPVTVVNQRVKAGWHAGELYLEVHPNFLQLDELEETYTFVPDGTPASMDEARAVLEARAGLDVDRIHWRVVEAELMARRGIPIQVTGMVDPTARRSANRRQSPEPSGRAQVQEPTGRRLVQEPVPGGAAGSGATGLY